VQDPGAPRVPLATRAQIVAQLRGATDAERAAAGPLPAAGLSRPALKESKDAIALKTKQRPAKGESARWITRSAMCAQVRNGVLYVFMPALDTLEAYLELVAAVEGSAAQLGLKVLLEGYEPPRDPRLGNFRVTPDPGVIEVNVQPSQSWDELVDRTEFLYQQAHETRLTSEKFMVDGRHTGTGGGNHFVLGGDTDLAGAACR
jgi:uncharacterized protein (DUF2126 family)